MTFCCEFGVNINLIDDGEGKYFVKIHCDQHKTTYLVVENALQDFLKNLKPCKKECEYKIIYFKDDE